MRGILCLGVAAEYACRFDKTQQATRTIPIVMGAIGDPLGSGVVTNLARPGANVTGCSSRAAGLEAKRLQLLKDAVPGSRVAILFNPTNHYMPLALQSARQGAQTLHVTLVVYEVQDTTTLDAAFVMLTKDREEKNERGRNPAE
jgi:putative ABC transport system substrate-binding protein